MLEKKRPLVGLVVPSLCEGGGVPAVALFLARALIASKKYDLKLVSLATSMRDPTHLCISRPKTWLRGPSASTGIWNQLPYIHIGAYIGEIEFQRYQKRKLLTKALSECDVIQVVCGTPCWANAVIGIGKPVSVQYATRIKIERRKRDSTIRNVIDYWRKTMTMISSRLDDKAIKSIDAAQVENPLMLDYAKKINHGRIFDLRYAPPGVNTSTFKPLIQRNFTQEKYILCVGRLNDPRKNIDLLLKAYSKLDSKIQVNLKVISAGSTSPPESFWTLSDTLKIRDRFSFIAKPNQEELISLYQNATMFILPSDEEGLGVVVLEAMACEIPVISTKSGGPDGIITDEKDGYLVNLDDADSIAKKITILATDDSINIKIGKAARATIESRFSEEVTGREFINALDLLIKNDTTIVTY